MARDADNPDVCIIGAGLAGGLLAYGLAARGFSVVLLEAGPRYDADAFSTKLPLLWQDVALWRLPRDHPATVEYEDSSSPPYSVAELTVKGVGGSTLAWLGTALRLHTTDFRMRSEFGVAEDWPLGYTDLAPYYNEAELEMGVAGRDDNPCLPRNGVGYPLPAFELCDADMLFARACSKLGISVQTTPQARNSMDYRGRPKCAGHASCIPLCPSGAKYTAHHHILLAEEGGLVRVTHSAPVLRLKLHRQRIESALFYDSDSGELRRQSAQVFVVCANTVETTRILLSSTSASKPARLLDSSGMLGKCLMDHPILVAEGLIDKALPPRGFQVLQSYDFYATTRRSQTAAFKLEFSTTPQFSWQCKPNHGGRRSWLKIIALFDMMPRLNNQICLSRRATDNLGFPIPSLHLVLGDYEYRAIETAAEVATEILREAGASKVEVSGPFWGAAHPSGTCRMGDDPCSSIVRSDLRFHDIHNLYVVGSSVFPSVGAANPSLTIAALALRTAEHIASIL